MRWGNNLDNKLGLLINGKMCMRYGGLIKRIYKTKAKVKGIN